MFNRLRKQPLNNLVEERRVPADDFMLRNTIDGFESHRVANFPACKKFTDEYMLPELDRQIARYSDDSLDEANADICLNFILYHARQALLESQVQLIEKNDTGLRLANRKKVDPEDIAAIKLARQAELVELEEIREKIYKLTLKDKEVF